MARRTPLLAAQIITIHFRPGKWKQEEEEEGEEGEEGEAEGRSGGCSTK